MPPKKKLILDRIKQHPTLKIMVRSHHSAPFNQEIENELKEPILQNFYFLMLVTKGKFKHTLDFHEVTQSAGQVLFVNPWQIHNLHRNSNTERYGVSFGEELLEYLSSSFPFLIDPLGNQLINLSPEAVQRLASVFQLLENVLEKDNSNQELIFAYLNALLTECNSAYFKNNKIAGDTKDSLSVFIKFKNYIENNFLAHPSIDTMADKLNLNTNALYHLVKSKTGVSPKNFLTKRLILEAKRKIYFKNYSIKELAYELNYNDPEYFSRLFKKYTKKSISEYRMHFQDLSGS